MGRMFEALQKLEREKKKELKDDFPKITSDDLVLDNKLISFFAPYSLAAEQFRRLRTYIIRPFMEKSPKTLLVASALAEEGKSLVAINLAITIATELHSHALIVDCDLRNPTLSRWFGFHEVRGLSDYLLGKASLSDILVQTSVDKLSILPGGAIQDNPAELIGSNQMKTLLTELKKRYDDRYIILDCSPLLSTTEPTVLNEMVEGIILVIKSGNTPRESIQQALKLLNKDKIIGTVLNNLSFKTSGMTRRYFGTNRPYHDYHCAKPDPKQEVRKKLRALTENMKMLLGKIWLWREEEL